MDGMCGAPIIEAESGDNCWILSPSRWRLRSVCSDGWSDFGGMAGGLRQVDEVWLPQAPFDSAYWEIGYSNS
jgi:hypothetical protein